MNREQLISETIKLFIKTLDKKSKWFTQDLNDFSLRLNSASIEQIKSSYNNLSYMNSKQSDIDFDKETKRLEKAGMFNVGNMKPANALD